MGPYRTVRIVLYMFTHVLQVAKLVFVATHTLLHMSGLAVHYLLSTGKYHACGAHSLSCCIVTHDNTGNRLVILPCAQ